jgi:hypothetical protein
MNPRCKFVCTTARAVEEGVEVRLDAQPDPTISEAAAFSEGADPASTLIALIKNPELVPLFEEGKTYYLDITPLD